MPEFQEYRPVTISGRMWRLIPAEARSAIITAIEAAECRANDAEEQLIQANNAASAAKAEAHALKEQLAAIETTSIGIPARPAPQNETEENTALETANAADNHNNAKDLIFHPHDHELVGTFQIREESGVWKKAELYRRLDRPNGFVLQDVVLVFEDVPEYEVGVSIVVIAIFIVCVGVVASVPK